MVHSVELEIAGHTLKLETGHMAKQADGSILASYGDTVVLATAVASKTVSYTHLRAHETQRYLV